MDNTYALLSHITVHAGNTKILFTTDKYKTNIETYDYECVYDYFTYAELLELLRQIKTQHKQNYLTLKVNRYDDFFIKDFNFINAVFYDKHFTTQEYSNFLETEFLNTDNPQALMDKFIYSNNLN